MNENESDSKDGMEPLILSASGIASEKIAEPDASSEIIADTRVAVEDEITQVLLCGLNKNQIKIVHPGPRVQGLARILRFPIKKNSPVQKASGPPIIEQPQPERKASRRIPSRDLPPFAVVPAETNGSENYALREKPKNRSERAAEGFANTATHEKIIAQMGQDGIPCQGVLENDSYRLALRSDEVITLLCELETVNYFTVAKILFQYKRPRYISEGKIRSVVEILREKRFNSLPEIIRYLAN